MSVRRHDQMMRVRADMAVKFSVYILVSGIIGIWVC